MIDFKWHNSSFQPRITIMGSNNFGLLGGCCLSFTSSLSKVTGFLFQNMSSFKIENSPGAEVCWLWNFLFGLFFWVLRLTECAVQWQNFCFSFFKRRWAVALVVVFSLLSWSISLTLNPSILESEGNCRDEDSLLSHFLFGLFFGVLWLIRCRVWFFKWRQVDVLLGLSLLA